MKDWKAECDKLRGEMAELQRQNDYLRERVAWRERLDREARDKFKELLLDVLGR